MATKPKTRAASKLKRPRYKMPADVKTALSKRSLTKQYRLRPAYQRNDYIGWINRAVQPATRKKRIEQMLDELKDGGVYMKMNWKPR